MTMTPTRTTNNRARSTRLAVTGVFCFTLFQFFYSFSDTTKRSLLLLNEHYSYSNGPPSSSPPLAQEEESQNGTVSSSPFILESFAISFDPSQVEKLQERNKHANLGNVLWVPGTDGMHQRTLNLWAQLMNRPQSQAMTVEQASKLPKHDYQSPHAVGVYLAHWNVLRTLAHRPMQHYNNPENNNKLLKHAYLILEDDATCAPGLNEEIERTIDQLPNDWDLLFVGGKPFSYFEPSNDSANNHTVPTRHGEQLIRDYLHHEASSNWTATDMTNQLIRHAVCQSDFGKARGPLAPDGSRTLSQEQAYWRSDYLTNTHSYVVNPQRVAHVARLLNPSSDVPVDIRLGDLMKEGQLNAYMTTRMWCDQTQEPILEPQSWRGFFVFVTPGSYSWKYLWQTQMHALDDDEDCAF